MKTGGLIFTQDEVLSLICGLNIAMEHQEKLIKIFESNEASLLIFKNRMVEYQKLKLKMEEIYRNL